MAPPRALALFVGLWFVAAIACAPAPVASPTAAPKPATPAQAQNTAAAPTTATSPTGQPTVRPLRKFTIAGYGSTNATGANDLFLFLPQLKGWYRELGIDLEVVAMPVATVRIAAIDAGQVDAMLDVSNPVFFRPKGLDMTVVFNSDEAQTQYAIARPGLKIHDPQAWVGAQVRVSGLGENTINVFMATLIKNLGADPQKAQYTTAALPSGFKDATNAMLQGTVDATQMFRPVVLYALRQGVQEIAYLPDILPYPGSGLTVSTARLQDPEFQSRLNDVLRAMVRGKKHVADPANRDEMLGLIKTWTGNPPELTPEDYMATIDEHLHYMTPYGKLKDVQIYRGLLSNGFDTGILEPRNYPPNYEQYDFNQMVNYSVLNQAMTQEGVPPQ
jgi:ABC-type nitrate/sulfonate/bicarbonate transport system substrate-binding protein